MPSLNERSKRLQIICSKSIITNNYPLHKGLENELRSYLDMENISQFNNATIALITAIKALGLEGEGITTPYSFISTVGSLLWNSIKQLFVDIDANTINIDPRLIEASITPKT